MRDEFLMTRQGKQYVLFAGLLDEAHSRGLVGIDTELMQVPDDSNGQVAIVKANVQMEQNSSTGDLKTFSGIGDASPQNVSRNIVPHLIRMAEPRAKARALRDAINVSATALEELSDNDGASSNSGDNHNKGQNNTRHDAAQRSTRSSNSSSKSGESTNVRDLPRQQSTDVPGAASNDQSTGTAKEHSKAPQSQIDFIKTLAQEWRGEEGVERLEQRIGKPIAELDRSEAESWIDKLTPKDTSTEAADEAAE